MTKRERRPASARRATPRGRAALAARDREAEEIHAFLTGRSNGGTLLHALYDRVLGEPVPERLRTLLRR